MTELDRLVRDFAKGIVAQRNALARGDARAGNRAANKYIRAWKSIRACGDEGRDALAVLLQDQCPDIRAMAAACLLRYRTDEATRVLEEVGTGTGLAAFGASEALRRWEEGDWHLDPEE